MDHPIRCIPHRSAQALVAVLAGLGLAIPLTAQQTAQQDAGSDRLVVSARGVFPREATRTGTGSPANPAPEGLSPRGLRWTWQSPATPAWIARSVSVGLAGTIDWIGQTLNGQNLSVVASTDDAGNPPKPIYDVAFTGDMTVQAADRGLQCVVVPASGGVVEYWTAIQKTALYTITHPAKTSTTVEAQISSDGTRFAVGYTTATDGSDVVVYDVTSPTPTTPIAKFSVTGTGKGFRELDFSGDGSTVLLGTHTSNHVLDVASGKEIFSDSSTVSHDAHSISHDGKVWGRGGFDVGAWVHNGTTYVRVLTYKGVGLGFPVALKCDVSADGETFVAATYDAQNPNFMEVSCFAIKLVGTTRLWTFGHTSNGTYQDAPSAVSVSDDGKLIAVGSWGGQSNSHPEAMIFDRDKGSTPIASIDTPGSVMDLDLSGNGRFLIVGTKRVHANVFGRGGEAYSFDLGGLSFYIEGTASLNRSIQLSVDGAPADPVLLAISTAPATPVSIPGIGGQLAIDFAQLVASPVFLGVVPPAGTLQVPLAVGANPAAVGLQLHCQCARLGATPAFTNALVIPITP